MSESDTQVIFPLDRDQGTQADVTLLTQRDLSWSLLVSNMQLSLSFEDARFSADASCRQLAICSN